MPTLEIDLNCMCLFVPDPRQGVSGMGAMHVLLPCTHHYTSSDVHVAQVEYLDAAGTRKASRIEGWALDLGDRANPGAFVRTSLKDGGGGEKIVNLTQLTRDAAHPTGYRIPRSMINEPHYDVVSRISFYGGGITAIESQWPEWTLNGVSVSMAHKVTWRMQLPDINLAWTRLHGTSESPAPASLNDIKSETIGDDEIFRLHVQHVAKSALQNGMAAVVPNQLTEYEIQNHFRMFYLLLGKDPGDALLPAFSAATRAIIYSPDYGGSNGWACKTAQAEPDPVII